VPEHLGRDVGWEGGAVRAALWRRVSTDRQRTDNQTPVLDHFVQHLGYEVVKTYDLDDSAWNGGKKNGEYRTALKQRWTTRGAASTRCS
jgi:hypothetical protein